jgi:hypothetical protein
MKKRLLRQANDNYASSSTAFEAESPGTFDGSLMIQYESTDAMEL